MRLLSPGRLRSLLLVPLLALAWACDSASPVAPEGSVLSLSASPDRIAADGESTITVVARRSNGFPVSPGTTIFLSTTRGTLPPSGDTDRDGVVRVTLRANGDVGIAMIKANAGAAEEAMIEVQIGILAASVTLQTTPSSVPETGGELDLVALVRDNQGQPLRDVLVNFTTEVGTLESGGDFVRTDPSGRAEDTLGIVAADIDPITDDDFLVAVEVSGAEGELITREQTITIQRLPMADFTFAVSGLTVVFDDTSTGRPTSWRWDFGDENGSTLQNPTHRYAAAGTYTVTLTARNALGEDTRSHFVAVTGVQ
jgi:hypothetical protein